MTRRRWVVTCAAVTGLVTATLSGAAVPAPALAGEVDRAPVRTLRGDATQLWNPGQVVVAPDGTLVVANEGDYERPGGPGGSVTVHAADSDGDVAPLRHIAGAATGLVQPAGVDVDGEGRIYVADAATDTVSVFAPGADGNEAPTRVLRGPATALDGPHGIDVDGNRLAVANRAGGGVLVFVLDELTAPDIDLAPDRHLVGDRTQLDAPLRVVLSDGELTVGTSTGKVLTYAPGAHGDAQPTRTLTDPLGGADLITGLAFDAERRLHVTGQYGARQVAVFAPGATSTAGLLASLAGELHDLDSPRGLALRPDGQVVVTDEADDSVHTYADLLAATPPPPPAPVVRTPGPVRTLAVSPGPRTPRRVVTWTAPASDGGARVAAYRVVVKQGGRTVLTRTVTTRRTVLRRATLPRGRLVVRVQARNSVGVGPATTKAFRVRR